MPLQGIVQLDQQGLAKTPPWGALGRGAPLPRTLPKSRLPAGSLQGPGAWLVGWLVGWFGLVWFGWLVGWFGLGVLARPGTPRDPKSHFFGTNWVAIQPFFKPKLGSYAEFRRGSRQIGPTPSISTFFRPFLDPQTAQKLKKLDFLTRFRYFYVAVRPAKIFDFLLVPKMA